MYNSIGQLTANADEKIASITYYPNGQIKQITFTNNNTSKYYYDDQGTKYKTAYFDATTNSTKYTWYIFNAIYEYQTTGGAPFSLKQLSLNAGGRVGVYKQDTIGIAITKGHTEYELTDHLGNVRVTFKQGANNTLQVLSKTDYYAFGGQLPGRIWQQSGGDYKYGYQGQEKSQQTVNWDEFELRQYNHDIGRWSAPDPYGQFASPYIGMANNPISGVDPDGGYVNGGEVAHCSALYWMREKYRNVLAAYKGGNDYGSFVNNYRNAYNDLEQHYLYNVPYGEAPNEVKFLEALKQLNNDFMGVGFPASMLNSGIDKISQSTILLNEPLIQNVMSQNGSFQAAEGMVEEGKRSQIDPWFTMNPVERRHFGVNSGVFSSSYSLESASREKQQVGLRDNASNGETNDITTGYIFNYVSDYGDKSISYVNTDPRNKNTLAQSNGGGDPPTNGQNGIGLNIGAGIGVMAQAVEFNVGAFVNSNGVGQMYFSYGKTVNMPVYVNAGVSAQALYIHTQAPKINLSGKGNTAGIGLGSFAGSYGYSYNDKSQRTDIYGLGVGAGIKYSGGYTETKTWVFPFINWWPSMMPGH